MREKIGGVLLLLIFLFTPLAGLAGSEDFFEGVAEEFGLEEVDPGVLPDSFWYWSDVFVERAQSFLILSKQQRVDYILETSDEKLAEAEVMLHENMPTDAQKALQQYDYNIARAEQVFYDAIQDGIVFTKETQDEFETAILVHERAVESALLQIPPRTMYGMNISYDAIVNWFNKFLAHLKWKKEQIEVKQASLFD